MKRENKNNQEILVKFNQVKTPKQLDEKIYTFEKNMNKLNNDYFLKESENPFIYFLEYPNPNKLVKELKYEETLDKTITLTPVICVISNINYITTTILKKIKHKISYNDTFNIKCHMDSYSIIFNKKDLEKELTSRIKESTHISQSNIDPIWTINIYIIGDITAINIKRSNKNRNKYKYT